MLSRQLSYCTAASFAVGVYLFLILIKYCFTSINLAVSYLNYPIYYLTITMTVNNTIAHQRLILSGDRERFKDLLRRRLIECGWRDQIRLLCREVIKENDGANITLDSLVTRVTPRARVLVPDTVKKELLQKIKTHLLTQKE